MRQGLMRPAQPHLRVQVVEAQRHVQRHLAPQALPPHRLRVVPQRRVQVTALRRWARLGVQRSGWGRGDFPAQPGSHGPEFPAAKATAHPPFTKTDTVRIRMRALDDTRSSAPPGRNAPPMRCAAPSSALWQRTWSPSQGRRRRTARCCGGAAWRASGDEEGGWARGVRRWVC